MDDGRWPVVMYDPLGGDCRVGRGVVELSCHEYDGTASTVRLERTARSLSGGTASFRELFATVHPRSHIYAGHQPLEPHAIRPYFDPTV